MAVTIWRGRLVFGLVSIPVRLYKAARRERVQFHNVYRPAEQSAPASAAPDPSSNIREFPRQQAPEEPYLPDRVARVHRVFVGNESQILTNDEIFKAYEVEPERYVVLRSSEVAALRAPSSTNLEIALFVELNQIDRNYLDASYYLAPDHGGEKAYALFYRALADTGCVAVGELVMYGREYAVAIRPGVRGLLLHTLFFADEVRIQEEAQADLGLVDEKELELAKMLIEAKRGAFDGAKLKDKFRERVLGIIENRIPSAVPATVPVQERSGAPVLDIKDALQKSLDALRKPAQSEPARPAPGKKDKRRAK